MLPAASATADRSTAVTITAAHRCGTAQANGTANPGSRLTTKMAKGRKLGESALDVENPQGSGLGCARCWL